MTNPFCRQLLDPSGSDGGAWRRSTFDELADLIGAGKANELAMRFGVDLRARFANVTRRESIGRDAHAVTATSAVLGFARLSRVASALEAACETGDAFDVCLQALLTARRDAIRALDGIATPDKTAT